jgi:transcriptional regulator with XRE-family HTH domain
MLTVYPSEMARSDEESTEFGKRLRQRREELKLTVGKLAQLAGLTEGAIRQMESGQTKNAILPNGLMIAHVLGVSPWWLVAKEEPRSCSAVSTTGTGKTETAAAHALVIGGRSEEAVVAAILSRLSDPSDDDLLDALLTRLEPYVLEAVRTAVQSAVQASTRDLRRRVQTMDASLLESMERLSQIDRVLSERGPRLPKDRSH